MEYRSKILYNPTDKAKEWTFENRVYIMDPHEKRLFEGYEAHFALTKHGLGLKEYVPSEDDGEVASTKVDYKKIAWRRLVSIGSSRGVFKPGMQRAELEDVLRRLDEQHGEL